MYIDFFFIYLAFHFSIPLRVGFAPAFWFLQPSLTSSAMVHISGPAILIACFVANVGLSVRSQVQANGLATEDTTNYTENPEMPSKPGFPHHIPDLYARRLRAEEVQSILAQHSDAKTEVEAYMIRNNEPHDDESLAKFLSQFKDTASARAFMRGPIENLSMRPAENEVIVMYAQGHRMKIPLPPAGSAEENTALQVIKDALDAKSVDYKFMDWYKSKDKKKSLTRRTEMTTTEVNEMQAQGWTFLCSS